MKISKEFSKHAESYASYNIIQKKVITKLLADLQTKPKRILDLGCGSGSLCEAIDWEYESFLGVDFAQGMLEKHPQSESIKLLFGDFNTKELLEKLEEYSFEHIFSASALQWAENLEEVFASIAAFHLPTSLAIFTAGTFKTLHKTASLEPLLRDKEELQRLESKYFKANFERVQYRLEFNGVREMLRYIKKSGVSGARHRLSYKETKRLIAEYPLNYLEFEVVFINTL